MSFLTFSQQKQNLPSTGPGAAAQDATTSESAAAESKSSGPLAKIGFRNKRADKKHARMRAANNTIDKTHQGASTAVQDLHVHATELIVTNAGGEVGEYSGDINASIGLTSSTAIGNTARRAIPAHICDISTIAISRDSQWMVTGSWDRRVLLWSLNLEQPAAAASAAARTASGSLIKSPPLPTLSSSSPSATSSTLPASPTSPLSPSPPSPPSSAPTATIVAQYEHDQPGAIHSVAISQNGELFASAGRDACVYVWDMKKFDGDLASRKKVTFLAKGSVRDLNSPVDQHTSPPIKADRDDPDFYKIANGHSGEIMCVAFFPDSEHLASCSDDRTVRIWNVITKRHMMCLVGHDLIINCVSIAPDGQFLCSASNDLTVRLWSTVDKGKALDAVEVMRGHEGER